MITPQNMCHLCPIPSVSMLFRASILTVGYVHAVLSSFDIHLPCLFSLQITVI